MKNRVGDFDTSIATLKKAFQHLGVDSENLKVEIHDWLAQAYERKGEYTNAAAESGAQRAMADSNSESTTIQLISIH